MCEEADGDTDKIDDDVGAVGSIALGSRSAIAAEVWPAIDMTRATITDIAPSARQRRAICLAPDIGLKRKTLIVIPPRTCMVSATAEYDSKRAHTHASCMI